MNLDSNYKAEFYTFVQCFCGQFEVNFTVPNLVQFFTVLSMLFFSKTERDFHFSVSDCLSNLMISFHNTLIKRHLNQKDI